MPKWTEREKKQKKEIEVLRMSLSTKQRYCQSLQHKLDIAGMELKCLRVMPGMHIDDILQGVAAVSHSSAQAISGLTDILNRSYLIRGEPK